LNGKPFGIINNYASNDAHELCTLWMWLTLSLPFSTSILRGDFNMVEKQPYKKIQSPWWWSVGEREAWFFMKSKLNIFYPNFGFSPEAFP